MEPRGDEPTQEERRARLVAAALESFEHGEHEAAERACAEHPELAGEIRSAMRALENLRTIQPGASAPIAEARIGRFQILERIGGGGMGVVHRAFDPALGRVVALKVLPAMFTNSPAALERFRRESRALASIQHPHIVAVHDAGETEQGLPFFAMDFVQGASLESVLHRIAASDPARLSVQDLLPAAPELEPEHRAGRSSYVEGVVRLALKLAEALEHAHRAGLVHRDVKPGNVLIDLAGEPRLVDFGLARGPDAHTVTQAGQRPGTPGYMAPEQVSSTFGEIGPRTDVYGLGVTLYEALTLQRPFAGETVEQVFQDVLTRAPVRLRKHNPAIPRDLETLCLKALEKDPARRYGSAGELAEDLENLLTLRPIRARPPSGLRRLVQFVRRNPWPSAAAAALLLAGAAMGLFVEKRRFEARAELRSRLEIARSSLEAGDLATARSRIEGVLAIEPDDPAARELDDAIARAEARAGSDAALSEARAKLETYRDLLDEVARTRSRIRELEGPFEHGLALPDGLTSLWRDEEALERGRERLEATTIEIFDALNRAERFTPERPEVRRGFAAAYFERWRAASSLENEALAEVYRGRVLDFDDEGRFGTELGGHGMLALSGTPAGADVYLFRYLSEDRVLPDGERRLVPVPVRPDGAFEASPGDPLSPVEADRVGSLPLADLHVPPGSYLFVVRAEAFEDLRLPVLLPRKGRVEERVDLLPEGSTPSGFVWIPPGPWIQGGDPKAIYPYDPHGTTGIEKRSTSGFWIARTEVTVAEYAEFLDDPATLLEIEEAERGGEWIRVPRTNEDATRPAVLHGSKGADGRFRSDWDPRWPIHGVSCEDADAYVRWRNERAKERSEPWIYALPTEEEWERAARGADGRFFPWGDDFDRTFCKGYASRDERPRPEPVLAYPRDESPFGVRDLAGGVHEWLAGSATANWMRAWRGGGWYTGPVQFFRAASRNEGLPKRAGENDGFRLVARPILGR